VRTVTPLASPEAVFAVAGVDGWHNDDGGRYTLTVSDARLAAPAVTRALVAAGADVLSLAEVQHSLEDVYLELIADGEATARAKSESLRSCAGRSASSGATAS
jgi:ABC-2 type transport system ATP-binding protein